MIVKKKFHFFLKFDMFLVFIFLAMPAFSFLIHENGGRYWKWQRIINTIIDTTTLFLVGWLGLILALTIGNENHWYHPIDALMKTIFTLPLLAMWLKSKYLGLSFFLECKRWYGAAAVPIMIFIFQPACACGWDF